MSSEYVYPHHVFVSYSRHDEAVKDELCGCLTDLGIDVWSDADLTPGTASWRQAIAQAIETAGCMVVILSPDSKQSKWVIEELTYAEIMEVPVFPVLMRGEPRSSVPFGLATVQWVDLRDEGDYYAALMSLTQAVAAHLESLVEGAAGTEQPRYYYPNKWGSNTIHALEITLGEQAVTSMLLKHGIPADHPANMKKEFRFEWVAALMSEVRADHPGDAYPRIMRDIGHHTFDQAQGGWPNLLRSAQRGLQIGSTEAQITATLRGFARYFRQVSDQHVELREDADHWYWVIDRCPLCWNVRADAPICDYAGEILRAAIEWSFPQVDPQIEETSCIARGDTTCTIVITKPA